MVKKALLCTCSKISYYTFQGIPSTGLQFKVLECSCLPLQPSPNNYLPVVVSSDERLLGNHVLK